MCSLHSNPLSAPVCPLLVIPSCSTAPGFAFLPGPCILSLSSRPLSCQSPKEAGARLLHPYISINFRLHAESPGSPKDRLGDSQGQPLWQSLGTFLGLVEAVEERECCMHKTHC